MKTDYIKYLEIIKKYNPLETPIVELSFELNYEYEVLTIFNTLYEIGYTNFSKIKLEFIENEGTSNIYKCSGTVSTHMTFDETKDFLNWRKDYLESKKALDDLWTNKNAKPKPKILPTSQKFSKLIRWCGIIGSIIFTFPLINILGYYIKNISTNTQETSFETFSEVDVWSYNIPFLYLGGFSY